MQLHPAVEVGRVDASALLARAAAQPADGGTGARDGRQLERAVPRAVLEADRAEKRVERGGVDRLAARGASRGEREARERPRQGLVQCTCGTV